MATVQEYTTPDGAKGVIVRDANGHFLPGTRTHAPITHANARTLAIDRHTRAKEAAAAGIADALVERGITPQTDVEGWRYMTKHLAGTMLDSNSLRGMPETYRALGASADMVSQDRDTQDVGGNTVNNTLVLLGSVANDILSMLSNGIDNDNYHNHSVVEGASSSSESAERESGG